jgi:general secretion pathway protein J
MGRPSRRAAHGFTLVEVLLALTTLATVVLLAGSALRIGLRAWEASQRRVDAQQETRALVEVIGAAIEGAHPYRGRRGSAPERVVLFEGDPGEVRLVTTAPPLSLDAPSAPFHALVLGQPSGGRLRLVERMVPAEEPFADAPGAVLSASVSRLQLAYRDENGAWQERWDGATADGLPTAVRVELTLGEGARARVLPPLIVPIALGKRAP